MSYDSEFVFFGIFLTVYIVIILSSYLLHSFSVFAMSKKLNRPNAFLAFIPVASTYQFGALAGEIKFEKKKIKNMGMIYLLSTMGVGILATVSFLIMFVSIAGTTFLTYSSYGQSDMTGIAAFLVSYMAFLLICIIGACFINILTFLTVYKVYSMFYTNKFTPAVHAILSLFIPFYAEIFMLILSKRELTVEGAEEIKSAYPTYMPSYQPTPQG